MEKIIKNWEDYLSQKKSHNRAFWQTLWELLPIALFLGFMIGTIPWLVGVIVYTLIQGEPSDSNLLLSEVVCIILGTLSLYLTNTPKRPDSPSCKVQNLPFGEAINYDGWKQKFAYEDHKKYVNSRFIKLFSE